MLFSYSRADGSVLRYDIRASEVRGRDPLEADGDRRPGDHGRGRRVGGRRRRRTATCGCEGADAAISTPDDGRPCIVGQPDPRRIGGLPRRRDRARAGAARRLGGRRPRSGHRRERARHAGAPDRARRRGVRRLAAAGRAGRRAVELAATGRQRSTTAATTLPDERRPTFVASDDAVILNETRTGWVWTVPDGELVASSQDWSLDDRTDPDAAPSEEQLTVVIDPKPPVAEPGRVRRARGEPRDPARAHERPRPERGRAEHRPGLGHRARPGLRHRLDHRRRAAPHGARSRRTRAARRRFSYAVTDGTAEGGLLVVARRPSRSRSSTARTPRRSGAGSRAASCRGPTPEVARGRHGHRPGAAGLGRPRGRPAAAAVGREPVGRRAASPRRPAATSSTSTATTAAAARSSSSSTSPSPTPSGQVDHEAAPRAGLAAARADGAVLRGRRHDRRRAHRRCRAARDRHRRGDVARVGARARRRRGHRDRSSAARHPSTSQRELPARSASTSPSPTALTDGDRHGAHHDPARRCAAAAGDLAGRRLRASAAGRDARRLRGGRPTPRGACCCSATSSDTRMTAPRSPSTRSARTTCACRARRHPGGRAASAPSRTRSATAPTTRAPRVAGRGDGLPAAARARARAHRGR